MIRIDRKWRVFGALLAIVFISLAPRVAGAAETDTIIIKERGVMSYTITGNQMPSTADGVAPAVRPFHGNREAYPAGSAIVGVGTMGEGVDVVNYASSVAARSSNELVLNTTISKAEDDATLSRLARKVYMENGGPNYDNVTIFWHVGNNPEPRAPWGRTDVVKDNTVFKVIRIQQQ